MSVTHEISPTGKRRAATEVLLSHIDAAIAAYEASKLPIVVELPTTELPPAA